MFKKKLSKEQVVELMSNAVEDENRRQSRISNQDPSAVEKWIETQYYPLRTMNAKIYDYLKDAKVL